MASGNSTNDTLQIELAEIQAYIAIEVIIATLALFNNTLVLVAICKYKHLHTRTYWLIGSLAFADIGVATLAIPSGIILRLDFTILESSNQSVPASRTVSEGLCLASISFALIFTQISIFSLLIIAIDHFIAICYSLRYKAIVTSIRVKSFIAGAWFFGSLIGLIPLAKYFFDESNNVFHNAGAKHCLFETIINMEFMVYFNSFACTFVPLAIMFILYCCIFKSAKEQLRKIYCGTLCRHKKSRSQIKKVTTKQCFDQNRSSISLQKYLLCLGNKLKKSAIIDDVINQCDCSNSDVISDDIDSRKHSILLTEIVAEDEKEIDDSLSLKQVFSYSHLPERFVISSSPSQAQLLPNNNNQKPNGNRKTDRKQSNLSNMTCGSNFVFETNHKPLKLKWRSKFLKKEFHAARSLATVVGVFALCWLPLHIHNVLVYFNPVIAQSQPIWLVDFAILLTHANSFINPIIYAFHLRDMKKAFRKMAKPISAKVSGCK